MFCVFIEEGVVVSEGPARDKEDKYRLRKTEKDTPFER